MSEDLRKRLGRRVREVWVKWAERQPNPKPSWLLSYDELTPEEQDADECIGIAIWAECVDSLQAELGELETLRAQRDILDKHLTAVCNGVNRRCGCDANQLPLVSLDRLLSQHSTDCTHLQDLIREALQCSKDNRFPLHEWEAKAEKAIGEVGQ